MAKADLQRKLICRVFLPMVIGIIITLLIAYIPFYLQFPSWIDSITNQMINDRLGTIMILNSYLSKSAETGIGYPIKLLLLSSNLIKMYYSNEILIRPNFVSQFNYVNSRLFQEGIPSNPYGFISAVKESFDTGMWYLGDKVYLQQINDPITNKELFSLGVFDFFIRPIVKAGNVDPEKPIFQRSLTGFEYDGLVYANPTQYQNYYWFFEDGIDCAYNFNRSMPIYDPRCRVWYQMAKNSKDHDSVTITEPYLFSDLTTIGQTLSIGNWDGSNIKLVTSLDFSMTQVSNYIKILDDLTTSTYAFAVSPLGQVFVHPKLNLTCQTSDCIKNITELEMIGASADEINQFNFNILPLFSSNLSSIGKYYLNGNKIIIAVSPVYSVVSINKTVKRVGTIGFRLPESKMTDPFNDLKNSLNNLLYIEAIALVILISIVFLFCLLLTRYVTQHIIKPIDNLLKIIDRMMEGDLDINIEQHYEVCSKEITKLYTVFNKLKIVLRFGKSQYFTEDSEAIMNYAQALGLFLEFKNMEGVGVCYNNLGIIHYKNQRYHEAIECFAKALEAAESLKNREDLVIKRKHMLATTMLTLKKFDSRTPKLMIELIELYKNNPKTHTQAIECLLLVAENSIRNNGDSSVYLRQVEGILSLQDESRFPVEIFRTRIMYCKGLILMKNGYLREACSVFIECLVGSTTYEPETRKKCLEELKDIYTEYSMPVDYLDSLLKDHESLEKDIIFLIDYSMSMSGNRIQKTIQNVLKFINFSASANDRIAYIVFNRACNVAFNLTYKGTDCSKLLGLVAEWDSPRGGTAFYDAISLALQEFEAYKVPQESLIPFDVSIKNPNNRAQWIITLIDGEDNGSKIGYNQVKKKLAKSKANLIIIGLGLSRDFQSSVSELCATTRKGIYIDCNNLNHLDASFQTLATVISPKLDNIESLD